MVHQSYGFWLQIKETQHKPAKTMKKCIGSHPWKVQSSMGLRFVWAAAQKCPQRKAICVSRFHLPQCLHYPKASLLGVAIGLPTISGYILFLSRSNMKEVTSLSQPSEETSWDSLQLVQAQSHVHSSTKHYSQVVGGILWLKSLMAHYKNSGWNDPP